MSVTIWRLEVVSSPNIKNTNLIIKKIMNDICTTFIIFTTWGPYFFRSPISYEINPENPLFIKNIGQIEVYSRSINYSLN